MMTGMVVWIFLAVIFTLSAQPEVLQRPAGWNVRLDRPGFVSSEPYFTSMPPGWLIRPSSSVILYEPTSSVRGSFKLETEIQLLPSGPNEGYGVFLGGNSLDTNELSYTAFQFRRDGSFSIWFRSGSRTRDIVPWTPHPAIRKDSGGTEPVKNVLTIDVNGAEVTFSANGRALHIARRSALVVDGTYGFRLHENMSVLASRLSLQVP